MIFLGPCKGAYFTLWLWAAHTRQIRAKCSLPWDKVGTTSLTKLEELEKKKEEKIKQRDAKAQSLVDLRKKFDLCKDVCFVQKMNVPWKITSNVQCALQFRNQPAQKKPVGWKMGLDLKWFG